MELTVPDCSRTCHLGKCENCLGTTNSKDNMAKAFDEHSINDVLFEI